MKTIIVGAPTFCDATNEFICCLAEFSRKKIFIRRVTRLNRTIDTANCRVIFVSKSAPDKIRGYFCDACFGFSKEEQCRLNRSRKPTDYNGTFLDYIYEIEGIVR